MNKKNVLIVIDKDDAKFLDTSLKTEHWNIFFKIIDYRQLNAKERELEELLIPALLMS